MSVQATPVRALPNMTTHHESEITKEQYVQQVTTLVSALVASGRFGLEWHEPGSVTGDHSEFDGIDSDGERISIVGIAVGLLRDIHASWDEKNPLREDPPGGLYDPTPRKEKREGASVSTPSC
jgi:hypothetical protein